MKNTLATLLALAASGVAADAGAQMRPLDPIDWPGFSESGGTVSLGATTLFGQRAALLGSKGRFADYGELEIVMRVDRVLVHVGGSAFRTFAQQDRFMEAADGVRPGDDDRTDAGTVYASTTVALGVPEGESPERARWAVRFGVRLPTTDDVQGLERDETDFFASVARRHTVGAWEMSGELGASIFGVHGPYHAQTDPYQYAVAVRRVGRAEAVDGRSGPGRAPRVSPFLELTGHFDTRTHGAPRGNENLSEVRFGARVGGRRWLDLAAVVGITEYSPDFGVRVRVGTAF